ncbi:GNAT family N-acetyltransferase [Leucobacter chromiiresistens]
MSRAWDETEELRESAQAQSFRCGLASVDSWLQEKAISARPNVRTTIFKRANEVPVGFYAARTIVVNVEGATSAVRQGSDRDSLHIGFLLAQMGVREDLQGTGIGSLILREAMSSAARSYSEAPFGLFVVDAENENLISYYEKFGLKPLRNDLRLVAPMRKIVKALSAT